jgi:hypothetical protein
MRTFHTAKNAGVVSTIGGMNTPNIPLHSTAPTLPDNDPLSPANIARHQRLRLAERDE